MTRQDVLAELPKHRRVYFKLPSGSHVQVTREHARSYFEHSRDETYAVESWHDSGVGHAMSVEARPSFVCPVTGAAVEAIIVALRPFGVRAAVTCTAEGYQSAVCTDAAGSVLVCWSRGCQTVWHGTVERTPKGLIHALIRLLEI